MSARNEPSGRGSRVSQVSEQSETRIKPELDDIHIKSIYQYHEM